MKLPSSKVVIPSLRGLSLAFLLLSIILLYVNKQDVAGGVTSYKQMRTYRYMVGTSILGIGYNLLAAIVFVFFTILMESDKFVVLQFYGDKVVSYVLATASAAGFGASIDLKHIVEKKQGVGDYFNMGFASAIFLFIAFLCNIILSIMSSYALPKKVLLVSL